MKPHPISKPQPQSIPLGFNWNIANGHKVDNPFSFQDYTVPQPMPQKEIAPPPYLWDKIASVLDEQDRMRSQSHNTFTKPGKEINHSNRYILFAAIVMLVGAIVLSLV